MGDMRCASLVALAALTAGCCCGLFAEDGPSVGVDRPGQRTALEAEETAFRVREGAKLEDVVGEFEVAGERIRFRRLGEGIRFTVLENLALERVSRVLEETRSPPQWTVSGIATEYRGGNYLLITRAVIRSKSQP